MKKFKFKKLNANVFVVKVDNIKLNLQLLCRKIVNNDLSRVNTVNEIIQIIYDIDKLKEFKKIINDEKRGK